MHTLQELKSGNLIGSKTLKLACGLTEFPEEIFALADTLEVLDLSDNNLTDLPDRIVELKKLKIVFFARNKFTEFPSILAKFPVLSMIGFKSNQIHTVPENAFPPKLQWLILTDNRITKLPKSIGESQLLQKCGLAGNLLEELPVEMSGCLNLELLRISANKLESLPEWLFQLPRLSWVAFSGNSLEQKPFLNTDIASFDWKEFKIKELLGEGASGLISKADWIAKKEEVAIKVFKGAVTTDGLPADEMEVSIAAGSHENLIPVLGKVKNHPEDKSGLVLKLISSYYTNLGNPPSMETCTRDVFDKETVFKVEGLMKIAKSIASVCVQLHAKGINHGDLYAHNILVTDNADCLLGDFGAASFYDITSDLANYIQRVEVRAYGCLIEDVLNLVITNDLTDELRDNWLKLIADCTISDVRSRLSFSEILARLTEIKLGIVSNEKRINLK